MVILLQAFWRILMLRESPQTMPYSHFLLGIVLGLHLLAGIGMGAIDLPIDEAIISAAMATLLAVVATSLLLSLFRHGNRMVQTVTALAGCDLIISLVALPIYYWLAHVDKANADIPALLLLLLLGWNVAVTAHIWRHALGVTKILGFLFAIGYVIIAITLATLIGAPEG